MLYIKKYIPLALFMSTRLVSQVSVFQGFETTTGTWGYTGGTQTTETKRTNARSLRLGRDDGSTSCGVPTDENEIVFDALTLTGSSCPGQLSFYHSVRTSSGGSGCGSGRGLDSREGFAVYVKLNNSSAWTSILKFSAFSNLDWGWGTAPTYASSCGQTTASNPFIYNVPAGTATVQFKIITIKGAGSNCTDFDTQHTTTTGSNYDRGDEGFFIDDVSFTTVSPCTLPIELLDFYANENGEQNDLFWKVATEENVSEYHIQKSYDGLNFTDFNVIKATHNGMYYASDNSPNETITYYRLTTLEFDGSLHNYKIISVSKKENLYKTSIYQRGDELFIENNKDANQFELYDVSGKLLISSTSFSYEKKVNISNLAQGIYFIKLSNTQRTLFRKIIITKN